MGVIYKYDVPFGTNDASAFYVQSNNLNGTNMTQASGGGVTLDTHQIWGQPFNGKQNVDGDLTITHGDIEMGCGDVHIGNVTDNEGGEGGNLNVDRHTHTHTLEVDDGLDVGGDLTVGGTGYFVDNLMTDGRLTVDAGADIYGDTFTDSITSFYGSIDAIKSESITTDYLTVLKSATFFEVIIEKLKSIGGSIILSPADGFVCSDVKTFYKTIKVKQKNNSSSITAQQITLNMYTAVKRLYWIAETEDSNGNKITLDNQWQIGDFMMCQSFGLKQGTSTNVATKYYWCIVVGVGVEQGTNENPQRNYIEIADLGSQYYYAYDYNPNDGSIITLPLRSTLTFKDPGCVVNPSAGDNIVHLGNAYSMNNNRGNAIYISCVTSRDYGLTPPFIATYKSIDTFDLTGHRHSWMSPNGNVLRGQFFAGTDDKAIDELMKEWEKTAQQQIDNLNQGQADQQKVISSLIVSSNAIRQRVTDNENKISQLQIDINGIETKVENYQTQNSTQIKQNSDSITLFANELEKLKVTKDKIVLNGDTEVNGIVNINQDGTGLKLIGSNGESFTVGSNDIGSYSTFAAKTSERYIAPITNNKFTFSNATLYGDSNKTTTQSFSKQVMLCNLKVGQRINLTNLSVGVTSYDGANAYITNISVYIYRDDPSQNNLVWSAGLSNGSIYGSYEYDSSNSHWGGSKSVLGTYTATVKGDYYVKITGNITGTAPSNTSSGSGIQTPQKISSYAIVNFMIYWNRTLDAFGSLTYNGFGFNFGGGNLMFVGNDQTTIQYQGYGGLQITKNEGLKKLVPDTFAYKSEQKSFVNAGKWIGINDKIVRNVSESTAGANKGGHNFVCWADELIVATSIANSLIMILPLPQDAVGRSVYFCNRSTSDNFFVTGYGSLSTTNTSSNRKIIRDGSTIELSNESCTQSSAAGNTVYYGLKKLYKHKWQFTSDGTYWHAQLLS